MSALPLKADMLSVGIDVCKVPEADVSATGISGDWPRNPTKGKENQGLLEATPAEMLISVLWRRLVHGAPRSARQQFLFDPSANAWRCEVHYNDQGIDGDQQTEVPSGYYGKA